MGLGEIRSNLILHNLLNDDLQVGAAFTLDQRPGAIDEQLLEPFLDQRGQLEAAAHLVDDLIAFERFNHGVILPLSWGEADPQTKIGGIRIESRTIVPTERIVEPDHSPQFLGRSD